MKKVITPFLSLVLPSFILTFGAQAQCGFTGLGAAYCPVPSSVVLTPNTPGDILVGAGVTGYTFNPALAGPGIHTLTMYGGSCTGQYSISAGTYTTWPTAGNPVTLGDDQMSGMQPIGFNFTFFCNSYSQFDISSNGFITFSSGQYNGCCSGQFIPDASSPNNLIAYAWTDLNPSTGGTITYTTIGTAPNRKLIVTLENVNYYYSTPYVTLQLVLFEGTNHIEIHSTNQTNAGSGKTMGIEDINGSVAYVVAGRNSSYWGATNEMYKIEPIYSCVSSQTTSVDATSLTIAGDNTVCLNSSVTFTADGTPTFTWTHNNSNATVVTVSPLTNTTYTVRGTSPGTLACQYSTVKTVNVISVNVATSISPTLLCVGDQATITASGASSYTWSTSSNSNFITVSPNSTTTYSVLATNAAGCIDDFTATVNVNTNSLTVPSNPKVCIGKSTTLTASGAVTYTWSTGTPFQNITVSPTSNTNYSVAASDIYGCRLTAMVSVSVMPLPVVNASAPSNVVCMNNPVTLSATGATSYTWNNGSSGNSTVVTPLVDVTHYYSVTGADANGCTNTSTVVLEVSRCTGLNEQNSSVSVNIFPNPTKGIFRVTAGNVPANSVLKIYNALGGLVKVQEMNGDNTIDLGKAADGIYFVYVISNDKPVYTAKIVKE